MRRQWLSAGLITLAVLFGVFAGVSGYTFYYGEAIDHARIGQVSVMSIDTADSPRTAE